MWDLVWQEQRISKIERNRTGKTISWFSYSVSFFALMGVHFDYILNSKIMSCKSFASSDKRSLEAAISTSAPASSSIDLRCMQVSL